MIPTATTPEATLDPARVICSSITLRHLPLDLALTRIAGLGFAEIDLGALPGVCNHVPYELTEEAVEQVALAVKASGLRVRSVNADVGDLNQPLDADDRRRAPPSGPPDRSLDGDRRHRIGATQRCTAARAHQRPGSDLTLVTDQVAGIAGRCATAGLQLWIEAPHYFRLCYDLTEPPSCWPCCRRRWA